MAGDTFHVRANAWWNGTSSGSNTSPLTSIVSALISGVPGVSGGKLNPGDLTSTILDPQITSFLSSQPGVTGKPKAYLNWVLFDEQFKLVASNSGTKSVEASGVFKTFNKTDMPVDKNGYLFTLMPLVEFFMTNEFISITIIGNPTNTISMIYKIMILLLFVLGCKHESRHSKTFFRDIDIFTLKGIDEVRSDDFPNIEVIDSAGLKILKYHIDEKIFMERLYRYQEPNWITTFQYKDDTTVIYTKRIIYGDKCLEFSYTDTSNYRVFDIGVWKNDSIIFYNSDKPLFLEPFPENIEKIKQNSTYQTIYRYDTSGTLAKIIKKTVINNNKVDDSYIECYPRNDRSFFWWIELQDHVQSLDCK